MEDKIETVEESCASEEEQPSVDTEDMAKDKERIPPKDDPENNLFYRTDGSIIDVNLIQRHIQMKWSDKAITGYLKVPVKKYAKIKGIIRKDHPELFQEEARVDTYSNARKKRFGRGDTE